MRLLAATPMVLALSACSGTDPGQNRYRQIPVVQISCGSAQHADCSPQKSGSRVLVGLSSALSDPCGSYLAAQPPGKPIYEYFDAIGLGQVQNQGPFLVGNVARWYNFANTEVYEIVSGRYRACAFLDFNQDDRWQPGEPLGEADVEVDGTRIFIDDWS